MFTEGLLRIEGKLYNMKQNKKPSILYWGNELINFSIFLEKIGFLKFVVKCLKNEINIQIDVISSQYSVVMCYVLLC